MMANQNIKKRFYIRNTLGVVLILFTSLLLFIFSSLTSINIFFVVFIISVIIWNIRSRIIFSFAFSFLLLIPLVYLIKQLEFPTPQNILLNQIANSSYYFLVIGVLKNGYELLFIGDVAKKIIETPLRSGPAYISNIEAAQNNDTKEKPSLTNTTSEKMWDIKEKKVIKPPVI